MSSNRYLPGPFAWHSRAALGKRTRRRLGLRRPSAWARAQTTGYHPAMPETAVLHLTPQDLPRAAELCARAFARAPHVHHFFPDETGRHRDALELFRMRIHYGRLFGEVHVASPDLKGVAVWLPSARASMTLWREIRAGGIRLYRRVGSDAVARMSRVSAHNEQLREEHAPAPFWFLSIVAVDPECQGRGCATALLRPMLDRLDREGVGCYCEATEEALLGFYGRLGFAAAAPSTVPGTSLSVWPLVRRAADELARLAGPKPGLEATQHRADPHNVG